MATVKEALGLAIDKRDAATAGRIADHLREHGYTYARVFACAQSARPNLTAGDWEDLMQEAEDLEAMS